MAIDFLLKELERIEQLGLSSSQNAKLDAARRALLEDLQESHTPTDNEGVLFGKGGVIDDHLSGE